MTNLNKLQSLSNEIFESIISDNIEKREEYVGEIIDVLLTIKREIIKTLPLESEEYNEYKGLIREQSERTKNKQLLNEIFESMNPYFYRLFLLTPLEQRQNFKNWAQITEALLDLKQKWRHVFQNNDYDELLFDQIEEFDLSGNIHHQHMMDIEMEKALKRIKEKRNW